MSSEQEKIIADLQRAYEMQKKAREEADHLLEEKSRELYLKNVSLTEAMDKLNTQQAQLVTQEKLASVGQLGASLAHELNNPNAFIQNNLIALDEYIKKLSDGLDQALSLLSDLTTAPPCSEKLEETSTQIDLIRQTSDIDFIREDVPALMSETLKGTKRISSIANSLRYFANPDISTTKPLDVNECIEQAQKLVHCNDKLAEFSYELSELPITRGLPMLLSQALANLIQNAIESQSKNPKVTIRSRQEGSTINIEIIDNGVGIEADQVQQLFTPFHSSKKGQTGLGLSIVKHIVDQHKGQINIESSGDQGTCVRVSLPIYSES